MTWTGYLKNSSTLPLSLDTSSLSSGTWLTPPPASIDVGKDGTWIADSKWGSLAGIVIYKNGNSEVLVQWDCEWYRTNDTVLCAATTGSPLVCTKTGNGTMTTDKGAAFEVTDAPNAKAVPVVPTSKAPAVPTASPKAISTLDLAAPVDDLIFAGPVSLVPVATGSDAGSDAATDGGSDGASDSGSDAGPAAQTLKSGWPAPASIAINVSKAEEFFKHREPRLATSLEGHGWAQISVLGAGKNGTSTPRNSAGAYARALFGLKLNVGLKAAYKEMKAQSRSDFWDRSGIHELLFYRKHPSGHHGLGCAVDFDADRNAYVPVMMGNVIASDGGDANWLPSFQRIFDIYKRAATLTGIQQGSTSTMQSVSANPSPADIRDQIIRYRHTHESLRAYFSLAYSVNLDRFEKRTLMGPLRLPPDNLADLDYPAAPAASPTDGGVPLDGGTAGDVAKASDGGPLVGCCADHRLSDDDALARMKDPTTILYPWYDHGTLTSSKVQLKSDDITRLLQSIGQNSNDAGLKLLLAQVRRDHDLFRIAVTTDGSSLPASPNAFVQVGGRPAFSNAGVHTHDPCNGFFWYHPAIPIGFALADKKDAIHGVTPMPSPVNVRCLGFATVVPWGSIPGDWAGDMMHFDFEPTVPPKL